MEIKLKKQQVNCIFEALNYDQFAQIETAEKVIELKGSRNLVADCMPSEPKTIKNWENKQETIKIREWDRSQISFT